MDTCPEKETLRLYLSRQLPEAEREAIRQHVESCLDCREVLDRTEEQYDSIVGCLRRSSSTTDEYEKELAQGGPDPVAGNGVTPETCAAVPGTVSERAESHPEQIGRYRIDGLLGSGSFGHVYAAHDPDLKRDVALKLARPGRFPTEQAIDQFLQEARAAAALKGEEYVVIHDFGREGDRPYIVMERVQGPSLKHLLAGEGVTPTRAARLIARAARAVHAAHKLGLVHRDLKPDNLLLTGETRLKVADFGLALHQGDSYEHRWEVAGTLPYMAPEQVRGEAHRLDGRTDVWSLGVILYEMLTRGLPFRGGPGQLEDEIKNREPVPPRQIDDTIDAELERICLKCLQKQPAQRYTTALDLARDLEKWAGTQERKSLGLRGWSAIVAVVCVAVGAVGYVVHASLQPPGRPNPIESGLPEQQWRDLFQWEPVVVRLPGNDPNALFHYRPGELAWLGGSNPCQAELGHTEAAAFRIRVGISKHSWDGFAGVYLGRGEPVVTPDAVIEGFQAVYVRRGGDGKPLRIERSAWWIHNRQEFPKYINEDRAFASEEVPAVPQIPGPREYKLEIKVKEGEIASVKWEGRELPKLIRKVPEEHGIKITCQGGFGLFNSHGAAIFRNPRFMLLRRWN